MQAGDLILVHGHGFFDDAIRFGERLRFSEQDSTAPNWDGYAWWNHVAVAVSPTSLVEAMGPGVRQAQAREYLGDRRSTDWHVVDTGLTQAQRDVAARFALGQVGDGYDYLAIGGEALAMLTGRRWALRVAGTWICSELAAAAIAEATRTRIPSRTGICSPADVAAYYGAGWCPEG